MHTTKKLFIISAILLTLMTSVSYADIIWKNANQVTVAWDAVTTLANETPLPNGNSIVYQLYTKIFGSQTETAIETPIVETQKTITLTTEGKYLVGVKSIRLDPGGSQISESDISWSDNPAVVSTAVTFGVIYYISPKQPTNLR